METTGEEEEAHSSTQHQRDQRQQPFTTLEALPSEILEPIVKLLPYKDRIKATQISLRWHHIVDELLGRKLFVGRACQFTPDDEERYRHHYVSINNLGKVGVNTCYVGEIVDPIKSMSNFAYYWSKLKESVFGPSLPKFKHPHLVKHIFFDGPLPCRYFDSIIRHLQNLERLDIHLSSLCQLNPANMNLPTYNKLDTLNIWGHKLTQGLFTQFYSGSLIVSNLLVFLEKNRFPNLNQLAMEYPFDLKEDAWRVTDALLEFLKKHRASLTKLRLCINLFITEEPDGFDSVEDRNWIMKSKAASKLVKLKNIDLNISSIYKVRLSKIWNSFVEAQTILDSATVMTFRLDQSVMNRICEQNYRTLVNIGLTRLILNENGRFIPVDCNIFQKCVLLKSLFLEGMPTGMAEPGIVNVASLPKTLEKIELGTLTMFKGDAALLFREFPNLDTIFLGDIGHQGEFGVEVETVQEVIRERRIPFVTLYGCVNGEIPADGISNGSPDNEIRINVRYYGMLELKLNEAGYYEPIPRQPLPEMFVDDLD